MNKLMLESVMALHGDCQKDLAQYLGISLSRCNAKINEYAFQNGKRAEFTSTEIAAIVKRYNLSPEQMHAIFFAKLVS